MAGSLVAVVSQLAREKTSGNSLREDAVGSEVRIRTEIHPQWIQPKAFSPKGNWNGSSGSEEVTVRSVDDF